MNNQPAVALVRINGVRVSGMRSGDLPPRTPPKDGKPRFIVSDINSDGPPSGANDIRRHVYRFGGLVGLAVRCKVKYRTGSGTSWANWYKVRDTDGVVGWQNAKPEGYTNVPYIGCLDPFEPEITDDTYSWPDTLYWPEGEKDVDRLTSLGLRAFTYGGTGDGLPDTGIDDFVVDHRVVILADNDVGGVKHAEEKAAIAATMAAQVVIVRFPELDTKQDVSDFLKENSVDDLLSRVREAAMWQPENEKEAGDLDQDIVDGNEREKKPKQADILIDLAKAADLFHTPDGKGFADIDVNGHRETWAIRSNGFRQWLARQFYQQEGGAPNSEAFNAAFGVIEAKASFEAPQRDIHLRVGGVDGKIYIDLCDETWSAIEIDAEGWRVVDSPPVRFRRTRGMLPLPYPATGGSINALRPFLNLKTDSDFILVVAWMLACMRNVGPYPVLVLAGEQGTAKSSFTEIVRSLADPNTAPLRSLPRDDRSLFASAKNGYLLAFDNVSKLPDWISDAFCCLATGAGWATRALYTDDDEALFNGARPLLLNGIEQVVERPDLADRAILLTLEPIPEDKRKTKGELMAAFIGQCPLILGALLDAVVVGLKRLPDIGLDRLPRMADFAIWATACETAFWPEGTFMAAYGSNLNQATDSIIEGDPIANAIRTIMATRTTWSGTSSGLMAVLAGAVSEATARSKSWPDGPRALAGRLRRAATALRQVGIEIEFTREAGTGSRTVTITNKPKPENGPDFASQPSQPSQVNQEWLDINELACDANRDAKLDGAFCVTPTVTDKPLKNKDCDGRDPNDGKIPPPSGSEVCAQCGAGSADDPPKAMIVGGKSVPLHLECKRFWSDAR